MTHLSQRLFQKGDSFNIVENVCIHEAAFLLKTVKCMLYLGYFLLRYFLIYNLEATFNFHLTFLQLNEIKMFTVQ